MPDKLLPLGNDIKNHVDLIHNPSVCFDSEFNVNVNCQELAFSIYVKYTQHVSIRIDYTAFVIAKDATAVSVLRTDHCKANLARLLELLQRSECCSSSHF